MEYIKNGKVVLSLIVVISFLFLTAFVFFWRDSEQNNVSSNVSSTENQDSEKINVTVSILPQEYFVEKIGGDEVEVEAIIPPGASPATFEPRPTDLAKLEKSEVYFRIGHVPFEKNNIDRIAKSNPEMKIVDTSKNVELREIEEHTHGEEGHDHSEEEHFHDEENHEESEKNETDHKDEHGDDPHIWLDPNLVIIQVENIYEALVEIRPEKEDYFKENKNEFVKELETLDRELQETFKPFEGQTMLVFHPAFGYLADRYSFTQEHFEVEGKEPSIEEIEKIISEANEDEVKVVFVQKQFSTTSAETIAEEIGGSVVSIDPLERNYTENLKNISKQIAESSQS